LKYQPLIVVFLLLLSVIFTALVTNKTGDAWEVYVRDGLYTITNDSVPDYAQENVDNNGVPFVFYPEQNGITAGKQYNPTIVCNYALKYYEQAKEDPETKATSRFWNCVKWSAANITYKDNYGLYIFNWQQPWYDSVGVPYTSGMTSGLAIEVFTKAYELSGKKEYTDIAQALLRGFYIPINSGGFTYKHAEGWWYEELADTAMHSPFILDGHIFATTGVHYYWQKTGDDSGKFIYEKGIAGLKHYLPRFDAGGGVIYYDKYGKVADKKYHRILTRQMKELYAVAKDDMFLQYYNKWNAPLQRPYIMRALSEGNRSGIILLVLVCGTIFIILYLTYSLLFARNKSTAGL
jgi:hypothetical protein